MEKNLLDLGDQVAITGASGFVGSQLNKKLPEARVLDRDVHSLDDPATLESFLRDAKVIFHLAGVNAGSGYAPSNESMVINNVLTTQNLIEGIRKFSNETPLVVLLSSIHVYSQDAEVYSEESKVGPPTYYGLTKLAQEIIVQGAARSGLVDYCILRGTNVYGKGCRPYYNSVIATFIDKMQQDLELELFGNGESQLDLIHVDDVVNILLKVGELSLGNEKIFNLSCGQSTTIKRVIDVLSAVMHREANYKLKDTPPVKFEVDNSLLLSALGSYEFISLENGLKQVVEQQSAEFKQEEILS